MTPSRRTSLRNRDAKALERQNWKIETDAGWWRKDVHTAFAVALLKYRVTGAWTPELERVYRPLSTPAKVRAAFDVRLKLVEALASNVLELCERVPSEFEPSDRRVVGLYDNIRTMLRHMRWLAAAADEFHVLLFHKHLHGKRETNDAVDEMMQRYVWGYEAIEGYERLRNKFRPQTEKFKKVRQKSDRKRAPRRLAALRSFRSELKSRAAAGDQEAARQLEELRRSTREAMQRLRAQKCLMAEADKAQVNDEDQQIITSPSSDSSPSEDLVR